MAIDEALFKTGSCPTLRFYSWLRPTLSIGYFQKIDDFLLSRCRERGVHIVRRLTGGRAVLHHHEITYSVFSPFEGFPSPPRLKDIYALLARWQIESLHELGIDASFAEKGRPATPYSKNQACFASSTPYEISVAGKKLLGNAQKLGKKAFLQHGSLLLDMDDQLYSYLLGLEEQEINCYTTMKLEGRLLEREEIIRAMTGCFEKVIGCSLTEGNLSEGEERESERLKKKVDYSLAIR